MYFEKSTVNFQNGQKIAWYRVDISNDELRRLRAYGLDVVKTVEQCHKFWV